MGIVIDAETCGYGSPLFFTSLGGSTSHWITLGATSIYYAPGASSPGRFRMYVRSDSAITPATANYHQWHLNWVALSNPRSWQFVYDGDGNRVKSVANGVSTIYLGKYFEWSGGGSTQYYQAGSQMAALRKSGYPSGNGLFFLLPDHRGSMNITLDSRGNKIAELRYKPWGEDRDSGYARTATPTDFQFTGQRFEDEFGLYFYGARWFDSSISQFTQPDSIIPDPYNSLDWNRYAYARFNPVRYNDHTGHDVGCPGMDAIECGVGSKWNFGTAGKVSPLI